MREQQHKRVAISATTVAALLKQTMAPATHNGEGSWQGRSQQAKGAREGGADGDVSAGGIKICLQKLLPPAGAAVR